MEEILKKIKKKKAKIGVIGLGYVGLPLCDALLIKVLRFLVMILIKKN